VVKLGKEQLPSLKCELIFLPHHTGQNIYLGLLVVRFRNTLCGFASDIRLKRSPDVFLLVEMVGQFWLSLPPDVIQWFQFT
jgi:hypothetical protein